GSGLGEAGVLLVDWPVEAVLVRTEVESAGEEVGVVEQGLGVAGRGLADGVEVLLDAGLLEANLSEVLGGADEDSGASLDGGTKGAEVAAGFRGKEEDGLLRLGGNSDGDAFFAHLLVPGLDSGEPVGGRGIGGSAEEDSDEEVVDGLGSGQIGEEPDLV